MKRVLAAALVFSLGARGDEVEVLGFTADGSTVAWRRHAMYSSGTGEMHTSEVASGKQTLMLDNGAAWLAGHPLVAAARGRVSPERKLKVSARGKGSWTADAFACKGEMSRRPDDEFPALYAAKDLLLMAGNSPLEHRTG